MTTNGITIIPPPQRNVIVTATHPGLPVITTPTKSVDITIPTGKQGPQGPPGEPAQWMSLTQEEYDAIPSKDPNTLYVIVP